MGLTISEERERLAKFAHDMLDRWPDGGVDEGDIQDSALKHGLLVPVEAKEPCGEGCWCSEFHGEFPVTCNRIAPWLLGILGDAGNEPPAPSEIDALRERVKTLEGALDEMVANGVLASSLHWLTKRNVEVAEAALAPLKEADK